MDFICDLNTDGDSVGQSVPVENSGIRSFPWLATQVLGLGRRPQRRESEIANLGGTGKPEFQTHNHEVIDCAWRRNYDPHGRRGAAFAQSFFVVLEISCRGAPV